MIVGINPNSKILNTHDLRKIFDEISNFDKIFFNLLPPEDDFKNYRSCFPKESKNSTIDLEKIKKLDSYELCYLIENVASLKYEFYRDLTQISVVEWLNRDRINDKFIDLFFSCRNKYKTDAMDKNLNEKSERIFKKSIIEYYKI